MSIPERNAVGFETYEAAEVEILVDHFYYGLQDKDGKKEELICEWIEVPLEIARPRAGRNLGH